MTKKEFKDIQTPVTRLKIETYKNYIGTYLIKVLNQYSSCIIADLFCGCGKNGTEDGSPLVLLKIIKRILKEVEFNNPNVKIKIFFNDLDKECIQAVKEEVENETYPKDKIEIIYSNNDFNNAFSLLKPLINNRTPKFIFLDPYTYSIVPLASLKELMSYETTEVLLFTPLRSSYRFSKTENIPDLLKTFLNTYTTRGIYNYENIVNYARSIKDKLREEIPTNYVREIILKDGNLENALFFITKHIAGMNLMNEIFWKNNEDGVKLDAKQSTLQGSLFGEDDVMGTIEIIKDFSRNLITLLEKTGGMKNTDIFEYTSQNGFLAKHAAFALDTYKQDGGKIKIDKIDPTARNMYYLSATAWKAPAKVYIKLVQ